MYTKRLIEIHEYFSVRQGQQLSETLGLLWESMCQLEQMILSTKINDAIGNLNPMALFDIFGKGYTMIPRGSIAYLIKGKPVPVELRASNECTQELPVSIRQGNNSVDMYCDTFSYTLR